MRVPADDSEAWDQEDTQTPERRHAPQQKPHSVMDVQTIARCLPLMLCLVALTLIGIALQGGARSGEEVRAWQDQAHCAPSQAHCSPPPPAHRGGGPPNASRPEPQPRAAAAAQRGASAPNVPLGRGAPAPNAPQRGAPTQSTPLRTSASGGRAPRARGGGSVVR